MPDFATDWELVSRKAQQSARSPFSVLRRLFARRIALADQLMTWTVRHRETGSVRKLTARTELEARVKITNGLFDAV